MSGRMQAWLEARWYGGVRPGLLLGSVAGVFGVVGALRRAGYRRGWLRSERLPVPVIVVGNLGIGGAGKTPTTIALVDGLRRRGWKPGVISRGYGGSEAGPARVPAGDDADPARFGDEPCLLARRTGVPVAVARRRSEAGRLLLAETDVDLLIADDGLQHYALQRDVELLVIDGRRRFGNGRLLPAGPLREPPARAASCAFRIVNGGAAADGEWQMQLKPADAWPLAGGVARPLPSFRGEIVHALAGIADPGRFFAMLGDAGLDVMAHAFADHHPFSPSDLSFDDGRPLLMTEKDAVKCLPFARPNWHAVPVRGELPEAFFDAVDAALKALPAPRGATA